ncbi:MAG TPA: hypothetical protein VIK91_21185, partial [Nannocystis sp.]
MFLWTGHGWSKMAGVRAGERALHGVMAALVAACEVAGPSDGLLPPDITDPELTPCTPEEAVFLRAALEPDPAEEEIELACDLIGRSGGSGAWALDLRCDGVNWRLFVEAAPAPAGDGFTPGRSLRITRIRAPRVGHGADTWLRVEAADGELLLAVAAAERLDPPDGSPWARPLHFREAVSTCMVEETDCGASQRGAVEVQLAGGPPLRLYDGTARAVDEEG